MAEDMASISNLQPWNRLRL